MNISLNNMPVIMAPIASKHDGISIIGEDSCIVLKLFSLLLIIIFPEYL